MVCLKKVLGKFFLVFLAGGVDSHKTVECVVLQIFLGNIPKKLDNQIVFKKTIGWFANWKTYSFNFKKLMDNADYSLKNPTLLEYGYGDFPLTHILAHYGGGVGYVYSTKTNWLGLNGISDDFNKFSFVEDGNLINQYVSGPAELLGLVEKNNPNNKLIISPEYGLGDYPGIKGVEITNQSDSVIWKQHKLFEQAFTKAILTEKGVIFERTGPTSICEMLILKGGRLGDAAARLYDKYGNLNQEFDIFNQFYNLIEKAERETPAGCNLVGLKFGQYDGFVEAVYKLNDVIN